MWMVHIRTLLLTFSLDTCLNLFMQVTSISHNLLYKIKKEARAIYQDGAELDQYFRPVSSQQHTTDCRT